MTKTKAQKARAKGAVAFQPQKIGKAPRREKQPRKDAPLSKASNGNGQSKARERRNADGSRTVFFEEYVQDINGSVAFSAASFPVQPGVPTLFAWLASQAISYQEYKVESLAFRFESDREATAPGKVMLAFQQDPSDALPAGKQEMLENEHKAKCKTWEDCRLVVPQHVLASEALARTRFIRSGNLAANLDIKLYDFGQLLVASQGQADAADIGELYVEYGITLKTPLVSSSAQAIATSSYVTSAVSISAAAPLGTTPTFAGGLNVTGTSATLTFQRVGKYLVSVYTTGTGLKTAFTPTFTGTATSALLWGISNAAADAGTFAAWVFSVVVTARGQTVILTESTQATTITAQVMAIAQFATA